MLLKAATLLTTVLYLASAEFQGTNTWDRRQYDVVEQQRSEYAPSPREDDHQPNPSQRVAHSLEPQPYVTMSYAQPEKRQPYALNLYMPHFPVKSPTEGHYRYTAEKSYSQYTEPSAQYYHPASNQLSYQTAPSPQYTQQNYATKPHPDVGYGNPDAYNERNYVSPHQITGSYKETPQYSPVPATNYHKIPAQYTQDKPSSQYTTTAGSYNRPNIQYTTVPTLLHKPNIHYPAVSGTYNRPNIQYASVPATYNKPSVYYPPVPSTYNKPNVHYAAASPVYNAGVQYTQVPSSFDHLNTQFLTGSYNKNSYTQVANADSFAKPSAQYAAEPNAIHRPVEQQYIYKPQHIEAPVSYATEKPTDYAQAGPAHYSGGHTYTYPTHAHSQAYVPDAAYQQQQPHYPVNPTGKPTVVYSFEKSHQKPGYLPNKVSLPNVTPYEGPTDKPLQNEHAFPTPETVPSIGPEHRENTELELTTQAIEEHNSTPHPGTPSQSVDTALALTSPKPEPFPETSPVKGAGSFLHHKGPTVDLDNKHPKPIVNRIKHTRGKGKDEGGKHGPATSYSYFISH